ncbi:MAG: hypothetical protein M1823_004008 [Watsoniomyces obsoletus]|nr:MAG: hypothetical protein M1823_004008 [Watsoniomyces obsoletus]
MLRRFSSTFRKKQKSDDGDQSRSNAASKTVVTPESSSSRSDIASTFEQYAQLIHASRRPLPTQTGDGSYVKHEVPTSLFQDLRSLGFQDVNTLIGVMKGRVSGEPVDDKTYLMERVIQLVSGLPQRSQRRADLTNAFVDELWNSLQHPPLSYLGDKFTYRQADGSYNNVMFPNLGAANTPYARSVIPKTVQLAALPDPGLIFDSVFVRKHFTPHPNNVSSVLFYWASIIIHDLFQTDHRDFNISKTSSYLDLSPLYGDTQEDQNMIRTFKDGKIKPDCFAEQRLLSFPPGCGVILIMFNRFHNYVVEQLAVINEGGRFTKPNEGLTPELQEKSWAKYDNDLFQVGRLITCGLYINITLLDYLRTIVNLNRSNTTWTLDPRVEMGKVFGQDGTPRGMGNQVSAEFNLVYRWHSAISERDDKWTQQLYRDLFGKEAHEVSMQELLMRLSQWEQNLPKDPQERPFAHLERQSDGKYRDDDLVKIIADGIEDTAGSFGANNVPAVLRAVEILGMQQARKWNCATLNEFRKFFHLKPHESFEEINSDPYVADQLRHLYEHPDLVEMYPGIVAEEAKVPMVPGVGIAPTFTLSRAILSDAIDYHPKNLTNWGYNEVQYDLNIEQGCVFYKLFLRAFPKHFKPDSIYAHYPMTIPSENKKIMQSLGRVDHYSYERPGFIPARIDLVSYPAAKFVLEHPKEFVVTWHEGLGFLMGKGGLDFMLAGDTSFHTHQRQLMHKALYKDKWHQQIKEFYEDVTVRLLKQKSCKIAGTQQVDLTRDIGNIAHTHFAANVFSLPLKTEDHPRGIYSEHELYMVLAIIFVCIFFDLDPASSFPLRRTAYVVTQQIGKLVEANVKATKATGWIAGLVDGMQQNNGPLQEYGVHMIRRLLESGMDLADIAWSQVLPTAVAMVANQAQVVNMILVDTAVLS